VLLLLTSVTGEARIPVEVWCGGDDGLTRKLRDALENRFQASSEFQLSSGKKPGTLLVTIPTNVPWKQIGVRTRVVYDVNFTSINGLTLGQSKGECWDSEVGKCVERIFGAAKAAARQLR
jgi:hypothetical protein